MRGSSKIKRTTRSGEGSSSSRPKAKLDLARKDDSDQVALGGDHVATRGATMTDAMAAPSTGFSTEQHLQIMQEAVREIGKLCTLLAQGTSSAAAPTLAGPTAAATLATDSTGVGAAVTLRHFLGTVDELDRDQREQLTDVALRMIEQVYVHLPMKRAMHAVEPIQRLKLLKQRLDTMSTYGFHDEMIAIFHSLRDLHTNYILPISYHGKTAFLPFLVEEFFEGSPPLRRYVVTRLLAGFTNAEFKVGVLVTHWNGIPIDRAVELNAEREAGSNEDARHARGLEALTLRPMALTAPPDEEWVVVGYEVNGQPREQRFDWKVFEPPRSPTGIDPAAVGAEIATVLGVDAVTEAVRRAKKALFDPQGLQTEQQMAAVAATAGLPITLPTSQLGGGGGGQQNVQQVLGVDTKTEVVRRSKKALFYPEAMEMERQMAAASGETAASGANVSLMPDVFAFKQVPGSQGNLGYIRIFTFMVTNPDAFVAEFVRIARLLPQNGLIIDVRGNPGGNILAGERLLQVLTPHPIEPERFHFINTPITLQLCREAPAEFELSRWIPSMEMAIETGEIYSQGLPLDPVEDYNRVGQQYQGPVVLIIDALCYSTTDIFAAGFQDHKIGKILGTHSHTGAGGANVWDYRLLNRLLPNHFEQLPKGATFRTSIRRTTRVKEHAGVPLEDLGVMPKDLHSMTRSDLLQHNVDLIAKAAQLIVGERIRSLSAKVDRSQPTAVRVQANGQNITRIDVYLEGRPLATSDVHNGGATLTLPSNVQGPGMLELRGFDGSELVVVTRAEF